MKGKSGNLLDPQGTATRAEIAAMLHRFIEKYELVQGKAPGGLMGWIDPKRLQIPKTGDSSVLGLWGFSLCTSLAGCLALTTWQIRRRHGGAALGYIVIGLLAFLLGVCVTVLCFRLRQMNREDDQNKESEGIHGAD